MTLAAVAARIRRGDIRWSGSGDTMPEWQQDVLVTMFEADPEFKLPEKVEALATEMEEGVLDNTNHPGPLYTMGVMAQAEVCARRLRELVKP